MDFKQRFSLPGHLIVVFRLLKASFWFESYCFFFIVYFSVFLGFFVAAKMVTYFSVVSSGQGTKKEEYDGNKTEEKIAAKPHVASE